MEQRDVVVVGGGPAGCAAAFESARLGIGQVLLLEKAQKGRVKVCGGGLSPRARRVLKGLGLWEEVEAAAYPIRGLRLQGPSGRVVTLQGAEAASVLPRSRLDALLADAAARAGAEVRFETPVSSLVFEDSRVVGVETARGTIRARVVIVAIGATGTLPPAPQNGALLHACMAWYRGVPFEPGILEMVYAPDLLPHYGWLFPEREDLVNIGICVYASRLRGRSLRDLFDRFLAVFGDRLANATREGRIHGHPIRACTRIEHRAPPGVLVAGERLGLVNVATGEGISYAIESGVLAARAASRFLARERSWDTVQAEYEESLRRAFRVSFEVGRLFTHVGPGLLDAVTFLGGLAAVRRLAGRGLARL